MLALAACSGDGRTVLTIYSPHGKDLLEYYEKGFEAAHPTVDVQWVDMGSQEVLDRLRAEKANPQADLWFGAPSESFERAAKEGLLEPYTPTWADKVPAEAKEREDALVRHVHDPRGDRVQHPGGEQSRRAEGLGRGHRSEVEGEGPDPGSGRVGDDARDLRRHPRALDRADRHRPRSG